MSQLQDRLLTAIQSVVQNEVDKKATSLVVKAQITAVKNTILGEYTASYLGETMDVVAADKTKTYSVGEQVNLIIQPNDMTQDKLIISSLSNNALVLENELDDETQWYIYDENLLTILNKEELSLSSYKTETKTLDLFLDNFGKLFNTCLDNQKNFALSVDVKTSFLEEQMYSGGSYGLILTLPFKQREEGKIVTTKKEFILDNLKMLGNFYDYEDWSTQRLIFNIDESAEFDSDYSEENKPTLQIYVKNFPQNSEKAKEIKDIYFRNIRVNMVDAIQDNSNTGLTLKIEATEGRYFSEGRFRETKTLTPVLKYNGETVDITQQTCYWAKEDPSIDSNSEFYNHSFGEKWKCLNPKIQQDYIDGNGKIFYDFAKDVFSIDVNKADVESKAKYKLIVIYNENKASEGDIQQISAEYTLTNIDNQIELDVAPVEGSSIFTKNLGEVVLVATAISNEEKNFKWIWSLKNNNNFIDNFSSMIQSLGVTSYKTEDNKYVYQNKISFKTSVLGSTNKTIQCDLYGYKNNIEIHYGSDDLLLTVQDQQDYYIEILNGEVLYNYDTYGNSPQSSGYCGSISNKQPIVPLQYKIYNPDGTEMSEIEYNYLDVKWYIPKKSMISVNNQGVDIDTESDEEYNILKGIGKDVNISYAISPVYDYTAEKNNTLRLEILIGDKSYFQTTTIYFSKDGENGTNGSKYSAIITYQDKAYEEVELEPLTNYPYRKKAILVANRVSSTNEIEFYYIDSYSNHRPHITKITDDIFARLNMDFKVVLYDQGKKIKEEDYEKQGISVKVEWSILDEDGAQTENLLVAPSNTRKIFINKDSSTYSVSDNYADILKAQITITKDSNNYVLYAFYPIDNIYIVDLEGTGDGLTTLNGGFNYVEYDGAGKNPHYDNINKFYLDGNLEDILDENIFTFDWTCSSNFNIKEPSEESCKIADYEIKPKETFMNISENNYLKLSIKKKESYSGQWKNQERYDYLESELNRLNVERAASEEQRYTSIWNRDFIFYFKEQYGDPIECGNVYWQTDKIIMPTENQLLNQSYLYTKNIFREYLNLFYTNYWTPFYSKYHILDHNTSFNYVTEIDDCLKELKEKSRVLCGDSYEEDGASAKYFFQSFLNLQSYSLGKILEEIEAGIEEAEDREECKNIFMKYYSQLTEEENPILFKMVDKLKQGDNYFYTFLDNITLKFILDSTKFFESCETYLSNIINFNSVTYSEIESEIINCKAQLETYKSWIIDENLQASANNQLIQIEKEIATYQKEFSKLEEELLVYNNAKETADVGFTYTKSMIVLNNRYSISSINDWDGNKLYIDKNGEQYIYAPQVGAGRKEKDGSFTGILIGEMFGETVTKGDSPFGPGVTLKTNLNGLFGYNQGVRTIFLDSSNGSAAFGKSGMGQIILDPSSESAVIKSGLWDDNQTGMHINLTSGCLKSNSGSCSVVINDDNSDRLFSLKGNGQEYLYLSKDGKFNVDVGEIDISASKVKFTSTDNKLKYSDNSYIEISDGAINVINNGSKTIVENSGVSIYYSTSTYSKMINDGFYITVNNETRSYFKSTEARIGIDSSTYTSVTSNGMSIFKNGFKKAEYGDTVTIYGNSESDYIQLNSSGVNIYKGGSLKALYGNEIAIYGDWGNYSTTGLGNSGIVINSNHVKITGYLSNRYVDITSSGVEIFGNGSKATITSSGMSIYKGDSLKAEYGDIVKIYGSSSNYIQLDSNGMSIWTNNTLLRGSFSSSQITLSDAFQISIDSSTNKFSSGNIGPWNFTTNGFSKVNNGRTLFLNNPDKDYNNTLFNGAGNYVVMINDSSSSPNIILSALCANGQILCRGGIYQSVNAQTMIYYNGTNLWVGGQRLIGDSHPNTGELCLKSGIDQAISFYSNCGTGVNGQTTHAGSYFMDGESFRPANNVVNLGTSSARWKTVYASTGSIQTSDKNCKKDIKEINDKYLEFFEKIKPVSYKFIDGTSDRIHIGFIAQEIEESMNEAGLTTLDFAGFCKDVKTEEYQISKDNFKTRPVYNEKGELEYNYSLRYDEFIALNTAMIQKQQKIIKDLEKRLSKLENK